MIGEHTTDHANLSWRSLQAADLEAVLAIQAAVHTFLPERREVFAAKLALCPDGCRMLVTGNEPVGYAFAHPWHLDEIPALDAVIAEPSPAPDCLFLHDVALLPPARGHGAGRAYVVEMCALATRLVLPALALVSVYDSFPIWKACGFAEPVVTGTMREKLSIYGDTARYMTCALA